MTLTVKQFFAQFPDDATCLAHLFDVRFGQGHKCPKCEREAKWYPLEKVRAFSCQWCGHHIHPTVGTLFEDSRTSLQTWFYAIFLFTTSRHGVPAKELQRQLGVTYKCAWRMGHEIRKHMADVDGNPPLSGDVEVDETYIGGRRKGRGGRGLPHKTAVLGMLQKNGDVITTIIPNAQQATLNAQIGEHIERGSMLHTDEWCGYNLVRWKGMKREKVNHTEGEYVRGKVHINGIEGYWSQLKRSISGTHIHVSKQHLEKYLGEFEYRFNSRKNPDQMFPELLSTFPAKSS
jgi:transposase